MSPTALLKLERVEIGFAEALLPPIDLTIEPGDSLGILGPNGAGKSTLLNTLLGLMAPLSGRLSFPSGRRPRIGYVPQAHRPDPAFPLSAFEVVLMGRYPQVGVGRFSTARDKELARGQLDAVGLADESHRHFGSLSGGQRQRVMLARALVADPELLVLDEPTSEMDPAAEHALLSLVSRLGTNRGAAIVFVTHEVSAAAGFARTVALANRTQHYFEVGSPDAMLTHKKLSLLYGRSVGVQREHGHTLVWINGEVSDSEGGSPSTQETP